MSRWVDGPQWVACRRSRTGDPIVAEWKSLQTESVGSGPTPNPLDRGEEPGYMIIIRWIRPGSARYIFDVSRVVRMRLVRLGRMSLRHGGIMIEVHN